MEIEAELDIGAAMEVDEEKKGGDDDFGSDEGSQESEK